MLITGEVGALNRVLKERERKLSLFVAETCLNARGTFTCIKVWARPKVYLAGKDTSLSAAAYLGGSSRPSTGGLRKIQRRPKPKNRSPPIWLGRRERHPFGSADMTNPSI